MTVKRRYWRSRWLRAWGMRSMSPSGRGSTCADRHTQEPHHQTRSHMYGGGEWFERNRNQNKEESRTCLMIYLCRAFWTTWNLGDISGFLASCTIQLGSKNQHLFPWECLHKSQEGKKYRNTRFSWSALLTKLWSQAKGHPSNSLINFLPLTMFSEHTHTLSLPLSHTPTPHTPFHATESKAFLVHAYSLSWLSLNVTSSRQPPLSPQTRSGPPTNSGLPCRLLQGTPGISFAPISGCCICPPSADTGAPPCCLTPH